MLLWAVVVDVQKRRIPNVILVAIALSGILVSMMLDTAVPGMLRALAGFGVGLALWLPGWLMRMMGAGDVKLFASVGAWLGPLGVFEVSIMAAVVGGILAVGWMFVKRGRAGAGDTLWLAAIQPRTLLRSRGHEPPQQLLPYSVAVSVAVLVEMLFPNLLLR
jgi:prepilin peptidase CpaA